MIHKDTLTKEWIKQVSKTNSNADEILIEKMIRALTLLELLVLNKLNFIFKGGTALVLMLPELKRLSIDIDIIISDKPKNIESIFDNIIANSNFTRFIKKERVLKSGIVKEHYQFYYTPITKTAAKEEYILLDILYEANHYGKNLQEKEITNSLLQSIEPPIKVTIPTIEAILGDKLTAFAPNTTGVKYLLGKEIEIIKQLYDIANLFDHSNDVSIVYETFNTIAQTELQYRELKHLSLNEILDDIYQTSLHITLRGQDGKGNFQELQTGITNIVRYIISENFHLEKAITLSSKSAYLSALLKSNNQEIKRFKTATDIAEMKIEAPFNSKLNKLKKSNPEAFFYWYHTTLLM